MTGPEDSHSSTRPISVAELLARNGTIGAPPVGGRRRRRRGNSDSITVAELTGEIPIVEEHKVHDVDETETTRTIPAVADAPVAASTNGVVDHDDEVETESAEVDHDDEVETESAEVDHDDEVETESAEVDHDDEVETESADELKPEPTDEPGAHRRVRRRRRRLRRRGRRLRSPHRGARRRRRPGGLLRAPAASPAVHTQPAALRASGPGCRGDEPRSGRRGRRPV